MPAGNVNLTAAQLLVQEGGEISVSSSGTGAAGDLEVSANTIQLEQGQITANTQAGEGDINLNVDSALILCKTTVLL